MTGSQGKPLSVEIVLSENVAAKEFYDRVRAAELAIQIEKLQRELEICHEHDELVRFCGSSFLPQGELHLSTGYQLFCYEPLVELELHPEAGDPPKCFDVLVVNEEEQAIIAIECKISHTQELHGFEGFIRDTWRKADDLVSRMDYLSAQLGFDVKHHEVVLCVRGGQEQRAAKSIHRLERSTAPTASPPHIVKLWYCDLHHGGRLQLNSTMARTKPFWNQHQSPGLNRILEADGYVFGTSEAGSRLFFKSPTAWLAAEFVGHLVEMWALQEEEGAASPVPYGSFKASSITAFLAASLNHYEATSLADALGVRVLSGLVECGIVSEGPPGTYSFISQVRRPRTAIKMVQEKLMEKRAAAASELKAERAVIDRWGGDRIPLFEDLA